NGRREGPDTEAQSLHGKLEHARLVFFDGKWHLKGLIDFIASAEREPQRRYQLRHSGSRIGADLDWWERQLRLDNYWRCFDPPPPSDISCFCDGSTSYGAGLHIAGVERSFPLRAEFVGNVDIKVVCRSSWLCGRSFSSATTTKPSSFTNHSDSTAVIGAYENCTSTPRTTSPMSHLGALPTVIRVASLYQIFRTASAAGSDPAGESSQGYGPDMMRAIDAWRANADVSATDPVPHSPPAQPSSSAGPSRITRRVLQPKQIAFKPSPLRPQCAGARRFETWTPPASAQGSAPTIVARFLA
ncbi:hypothetical protein CF336_g9783, partial [Tilletia laevis]